MGAGVILGFIAAMVLTQGTLIKWVTKRVNNCRLFRIGTAQQQGDPSTHTRNSNMCASLNYGHLNP